MNNFTPTSSFLKTKQNNNNKTTDMGKVKEAPGDLILTLATAYLNVCYHTFWKGATFKADTNYSIWLVSKEYKFHCKAPGIGNISCNIFCFKEI